LYRVSGSRAFETFAGAGRPAPSESFTAAARTSLVSGFQSRFGLSTTSCGMVCVTIRSITFWIVRCFARAFSPPE
jgi:hypothetical protein